MSIAKKSEPNQSLTAKANAAFREASRDVVNKAKQSGTEVVIWRDNGIVKLTAQEAAKLLETASERKTT